MKKQQLKKTVMRLCDPDFWRIVLPLAIPNILQNLLASSFGMVDTIMVGRLGDVAIAAAGAAGQLTNFIGVVFYGVVSGGSVFVAQYWGNRNTRQIGRVYGVMLSALLPISLLFMAVCMLFPEMMISVFSNDPLVQAEGAKYLRIVCGAYPFMALNYLFGTLLRSTERPKLPMWSSAFSSVTNVILNYGLIFGAFGLPEMGIRGAALASLISTALNPLFVFLVSLKQKNVIITPVKVFLSIDRELIARFWKRALPVLANEALWSLGNSGYYMVYGRMGTDNYAAVTIVNTIGNLVYVFFIGMCNACNVMVGMRIGSGRIEEAKDVAGRFMLLEPITGAVLGALLIALGKPILSCFNTSASVLTVAWKVLLIQAVMTGPINLAFIAVCGIFRAGGDTKSGFRYDVFTLYCISLPGAFLAGLVLKWPFLAVFALVLCLEHWVKTYLCVRRFLSMKWIQPVTSPDEAA